MYYIDLNQGFSSLPLQSDALAAPFRGAAIIGEERRAGRALTTLHLGLEGAAAQIEAALVTLGRWVERAAREALIPGGEAVYLQAMTHSGGTLWRSRVLAARVEIIGQGAGQRALGSQGARLTVEREPFWEDSTEQEVYLSSALTARRVGGVTLHNCWADAYRNYAQAAAADVSGELPAPLRLSYRVNGLAANGTLYAGSNARSNPGGFVPSYQGEGGAAVAPAALANVAAAAAAGGSFGRLAWSGTGRVFYRMPISGMVLRSLGGRAFAAMLRLHNLPGGGERIWAYWQAAYNVGGGKDVLAESVPGYLSVNDYLHAATPLCLPPWAVEPGETPADLHLELALQAEASGSHQLDIDFLYLLPLESWRVYRKTADALAGFVVNDNPANATLKSYLDMQGHQAEGPGLWAQPGGTQRFYFLAQAAGLSSFSHTATVQLFYRPRKANL